MTPLVLPAPAKINLYLHVLGKREDGYHLLDSLVAFTDIGDEIMIDAASRFKLTVTGPFAKDVPLNSNIVEQAVRLLCQRLNRPPHIHITLNKNLPVGSGMGGGSSDAAATIRGLLKFFAADIVIDDILLELGADVPACYRGAPLRFEGIGEQIETITPFPATSVLLVNPGVPCATQAVFKTLILDSFPKKMVIPTLDNQDTLFRFLKTTANDLTKPAILLAPVIREVLMALEGMDPALARMSGSGATCFALFHSRHDCQYAAQVLSERYPGWWVKQARIG